MKIKVKDLPYEQVLSLPEEDHLPPKKPGMFFRTLLNTLSLPELKDVHFRLETVGMEKLGKDTPALFLMNHSSFLDLKIASHILYPRPFNIVCTSDGFVGKRGLMRSLGCIPTRKFMTDTTLVKDMLYAFRKLGSSVLMYPEASYSFDGTATALPESVGKCLKLMGVPVVMIRTFGAFARDPLYNGLRLRKVDVSARMEYLLSPEEIREKSVRELNAILAWQFSFDNFRWQQENRIPIREPFRAEGLNRVLYKCPVCGEEGAMAGSGTILQCGHCGSRWELTEYGSLSGPGEFSHIPDWYRWERDCVRKEILDGVYRMDLEVDICMLVDSKSIYRVGSGRLVHSTEGFLLTGCDGKLTVKQAPSDAYSLYADYFWYEIGDMICIGDKNALYYCFPKNTGDFVAKARLATEEMYKLTRKAPVSL